MRGSKCRDMACMGSSFVEDHQVQTCNADRPCRSKAKAGATQSRAERSRAEQSTGLSSHASSSPSTHQPASGRLYRLNLPTVIPTYTTVDYRQPPSQCILSHPYPPLPDAVSPSSLLYTHRITATLLYLPFRPSHLLPEPRSIVHALSLSFIQLELNPHPPSYS